MDSVVEVKKYTIDNNIADNNTGNISPSNNNQEFLPLFSSSAATLDDSVFVIRKQDKTDDDEPRTTLSMHSVAQSLQSKVSRLALEEDLEALGEINQVFIKQLKRQTGKLQPAKVPKKFEVLTNYGERLFLATETTEGLKTRQYMDDRPFKFSVLNNYREAIFQLDGDTNIINIIKDDRDVGRIIQTNRFSYVCNLPPRYKIQDRSGATLYVLCQKKKGGRCGDFSIRKEFFLMSANESMCLGKVVRQNLPVAPDIYNPGESFSLSFLSDTIDEKEKALVIACVIVLDFQYFCKRRSYGFWKRFVVCVIVLVLLIAAIVLVIHFAIQFHETRKHRFPGNVFND
ncbi:Phospholipid scramblase 1 [Orchesella cincta]|uniref:Phospholipid scramblase n=1 Tax=Orchesella cincta TaxID=48709 RepID=A0A1D2N1G0_ORCCI|nr:Phospholipid scramblase 1 [Orchesella cincta]